MKIKSNYSLANETTFLCGGKAKWFCAVEDFLEFENLLKFHKGNYFILGGGSKTLCSDKGYDGLVISTKNLNQISYEKNFVICDAGVMFDELQNYCQNNGLSGLEWSAGIPASVGGAVVMNAGSFGHEFSEVVEKVEVFFDGKKTILSKKQIKFSYRNSSLKTKAVLRVWLNLTQSTPQVVGAKYQEYFLKKTSAQPILTGSAGSIFKRQENVIPAKLIDKLGLKGAKIGGAEVSMHHGGFIVNTGTATATDIINLIDLIRHTVEQKQGIRLEKEIIILE